MPELYWGNPDFSKTLLKIYVHVGNGVLSFL